MTRTILAHEATIKTATVEVKALTISGRQVTLSVFRQLKNDAVLNAETAELNGEPWGLVNYFWGDCAKSAEHLHIVWQTGEELRRACVYPDASHTKGYRHRTDHLTALAEDWLDLRQAAKPGAEAFKLEREHATRREYLTVNGRRLFVEIGEAAKELRHWRPAEPAYRHTYHTHWDKLMGQHRIPFTVTEQATEDERVRRESAEALQASHLKRDHLIENIHQWADEQHNTTDPDTLRDLMITTERELTAFAEHWQTQYAALANLEHLFIAV